MRFTTRAAAVATAAAMFLGVGASAAGAVEKSTDDVVRKALLSAPQHATVVQDDINSTVVGQEKKATVQLGPEHTLAVTPLDTANSVSVAQPDGVQVLTVLRKGDTARFKVDVPKDMKLVQDGDVLKIQADGPEGAVDLAVTDAPWAVDADGRQLQTTFSLRGNTVVQQVVTEGAAYPITVDPYFVRKWYGAQIRFTKTETGIMASGAAGVALVLSWIPDPTFATKIAAAGFGVVAWSAGTALGFGKCVAYNVYYWAGANPWYWSC